MLIVHFSPLIWATIAYAYGDRPVRRLSAETEALLNSRLIFVYDDDGCRELEGLQEYSFPGNSPPDMPYHRLRALGELERRITEQWKEKVEHSDVDHARSLEQVAEPPTMQTVYLEALQMEIASVPHGMSLQDLEEVATNLPCVKFVSRDDVKFAEPRETTEGTELVLPPSAVSELSVTEGVPGLALPPSDPLWRYQWGLQKGDESTFGTNVEAVWNEWDWRGSENMTIAIIDSGCNLVHPDMNGQFWRNSGETNCNDGIDDDGNGFVDDCYGWDFVDEDNEPQAQGTSHGTAAAGIIAAGTDNLEGVAGICWNCKLMCLRFISNTEGTVANEVRAIDYAVRMGAKISNNSYGGYAHSGNRVEQEAIERANRKGHLFITSAGNNNIGTDTSEYIHTPSGYPVDNVLAVGASTETGRKTSFSNWGAKTVHMFAPGRNVISTGRDGYLINQGTSFAAPHVAGIAGLVWSRFPELTSSQIVKILMESCRTSRDLQNLARCGGVINAELAMRGAELAWLKSEAQVQREFPKIEPDSSAIQDALRSVGDPQEKSPPPVIAFAPLPLPVPSETEHTSSNVISGGGSANALGSRYLGSPASNTLSARLSNLLLSPTPPNGLVNFLQNVLPPGIALGPEEAWHMQANGLRENIRLGSSDQLSFVDGGHHLMNPIDITGPIPSEATLIDPYAVYAAMAPSQIVNPAPAAYNDMWAPGIRSSTLAGGGALTDWFPVAKRIARAPLNGVLDFISAGLQRFPHHSITRHMDTSGGAYSFIPPHYLVNSVGGATLYPFATPFLGGFSVDEETPSLFESLKKATEEEGESMVWDDDDLRAYTSFEDYLTIGERQIRGIEECSTEALPQSDVDVQRGIPRASRGQFATMQRQAESSAALFMKLLRK